MRDNSGFMGQVYVITEWIMRFSVINILWFIINIPISIILLNIFLSDSSNGIIMYSIPLVLLIPSLFIPSTIAMFATVRDWIMQNEQQSLWKIYLKHVKTNYMKSLLSGLALMFIWLIWFVDFYYFNKISNLLSMLFLIIGLLLFVYTINFFSLSVHYQMNTRALLKNAFFVTIGSPLLSFFILISNLSLFYFSASEFFILFPLFTGSVSAYLSFYAFYRFTLKMGKKQL